MGTIPVAPSFVAGEKPSGAKMTSIKTAVDFWAGPPKCSVYQGTTATTMTTGVSTVIGFDTELFDVVQSGDTPSHDTATNNSRIVCRTAGKYEISGQVMFASNATGSRVVQVRMNAAGNAASGTQICQTSQGPVSGASTSVPIGPIEVDLAVGDYIEMFGLQASGGNLASNTGRANTYLRMAMSGT